MKGEKQKKHKQLNLKKLANPSSKVARLKEQDLNELSQETNWSSLIQLEVNI